MDKWQATRIAAVVAAVAAPLSAQEPGEIKHLAVEGANLAYVE